MPRLDAPVVFDCNVLLQAALWRHGASARCLSLVEAGEIKLHITLATMRELRHVLLHPRTVERSPDFTDAMRNAFLSRIWFRAQVHRYVRPAFELARDPTDSIYVNLAAACGAGHLLTSDRDLLDLMTGFDADAKRVQQRLPRLKIVTPKAFLDECFQPPAGEP
jgi:putative PIN family toxin of toxin-antitoxin system